MRSHVSLKEKERRTIIVLAILGLLRFFPGQASGNEPAVLSGLVGSVGSGPIPGARITVSCPERDYRRILITDGRGAFVLTGLPYGNYGLVFEAKGFQTVVKNGVLMEPSRWLWMDVHLPSTEPGTPPGPAPVMIDLADSASQTILSEHQVRALPSGNSVWSLIENQDLSATTNRIDVGGLWASIPARFSARGGTSWTQNAYSLNGVDATDPVWTGMPLFYPDFFSLGYLTLKNAEHAPRFVYPGGDFSLVPKEGGSSWHGGVSAFYTDRNLASTNITPALEKENLFESHTFGYFRNGNIQISGPLVPRKLFVFTSLTALDEGRDIAEFSEEDQARVFSGLVNLKYKTAAGEVGLFWTGQDVRHPTFGADRGIPVVSTTDQKNLFNILHLTWESRVRDRHHFSAGLGYSLGILRSRLQEGAAGTHGEEIFRKTPSGTAACSGRDVRSSVTLFARGRSLLGSAASVLHSLDYGFELRSGASTSDSTVPGNLHRRFFDGNPLEVVLFNSPFSHRESGLSLESYFQDCLVFRNLISVSFGLHLSSAKAWVPARGEGASAGQSKATSEIDWLSLSPRLALRIPLAKKRTSAIRVSIARYYSSLPLHLMAWGNPDSPSGTVYSWNDSNKDSQFQEGEAGAIIRREGPGFSLVDPNLKRPFTDEFSLALLHSLGRGFRLTISGFYRENRDLLETLNTGVPFAAYEPVPFTEAGDDLLPNTHDDLAFTVFNQRPDTLGRDFFLLTNPDADGRTGRYRGLDLTVVKKYAVGSVFFFSFQAIEAVGTTSPGNTEWENDEGIPGSLFDNPNASINARGRVRFDRGYTARIGLTLRLPLGIRSGCLIKYYDGQPFARKIIISGLNQGPFIIQAHPRGVTRYEYNMTVDLRLEKVFPIGSSRLRFILDGFNIFNQNLATAENEWTGPEWPLRYATEIQSPRVFRVGVAYEF